MDSWDNGNPEKFEHPAKTGQVLSAQPVLEIIARRAYHIWDPMIDEASEESFPASDPPAWTHCTIT